MSAPVRSDPSPVPFGWIAQVAGGVLVVAAVVVLPWATRVEPPPFATTVLRAGPHGAQLVGMGVAIVVAGLIRGITGNGRTVTLVLAILGGLVAVTSVVLALGAIDAANSGGVVGTAHMAGAAYPAWSTTSYGVAGGISVAAGVVVLLIAVLDRAAATARVNRVPPWPPPT